MKKIIIGIFLLVILPLIGCSGDTSALEQRIADLESQLASATTVEVVKEGISQEDYDRVVAELNAANAKIENLEGEIKSLKGATPEPSEPSEPTEPTTSTSGYERSNPAAIGTELLIEDEWFGETYKFNITLLEVVRGAKAWSRIEEANMFNDPPSSGFEYVLAKIRVKYLEGPSLDTSYDVSDIKFTAVSYDGKDYENPWVVNPEPELRTTLYPGASHEGWGAFVVAVQDNKPLITFGRDYRGRGGAWWQLY